jgi:Asp-tRNA(Asn)/Glu-tRNA(Gln) amidotransferase B subunit
MRNKKNSIDYKYCAEPNILPIDISNIVDNIKLDKKSLPCNIAIYLEENGLNKEMVNLLLNDYKIYKVFQYANKKINDFNLCAS